MQLDHLWAGTHGRVRRIQNPVIAQDQGVDHIAPLLLHLLYKDGSSFCDSCNIWQLVLAGAM